MTSSRIPIRSEISAADTWDLGVLYPTPEDWTADFGRPPAQYPALCRVQGQARPVRRESPALPRVRQGPQPPRRAAGPLRLAPHVRGQLGRRESQALRGTRQPPHESRRSLLLPLPGDPGHRRLDLRLFPGRSASRRLANHPPKNPPAASAHPLRAGGAAHGARRKRHARPSRDILAIDERRHEIRRPHR